MAKFPEPPRAAELAKTRPAFEVLSAGAGLARVYFRGGLHPRAWDEFRAFGPTDSRFDHHLGSPPRVQQRKIMYAARSGPTCLAEVFQTTRTIDRCASQPWLVVFALARDVRLLDLSGTWPTRAGASTNIHSGPRARARRWSAAIYEAWPEVDGLRYASSMHGNEPAVALYERAEDAMPSAPLFNRQLADPLLHTVCRNAAANLGYRLV